MASRTIVPRIRAAKYRSEYLGWLLAALFLAIIVHTMFLSTLVGMVFGLSPYVGLVMLFFCPASMGPVSYFTARTFAPAGRISKQKVHRRSRPLYGLLAFFVLYWIVTAALVNLSILPREQIVLLSIGILGLLYLLAITFPWVNGVLKNEIEKYSNYREHESQRAPGLLDALREKSKKKTLTLGIFILGISILTGFFFAIEEGLLTGIQVGLGLFTGLAAFIDSLLFFLPE